MSIELVQDIHLSDEQLWGYFQQYWNEGNYVAAVNLLNNNQQLATKYFNAGWLNALTSFVYALETNLDETFKTDKIKISYFPPSLETGEVWFQIEIGDMQISATIETIDTSSTSVTINYTDTFINAFAFKDSEIVKTNVQINANSVVFDVNETPDCPITCVVFHSDSEYITSTQQLSSSTGISISYTGDIISIYAIDSNNMLVECDTTLNNTVDFSIAESTSLTYVVVTIYSAQVGNLINTNSGTISINTTVVNLVCDGLLISHLLTQNNQIVATDVVFNSVAIISTQSMPSEDIEATIYYT